MFCVLVVSSIGAEILRGVWLLVAGVKAAEAERIVAVGSSHWKVKARLNLRVPQAVGRGAVVVDCCGEKIRGAALCFTPAPLSPIGAYAS